MVQRVERRVCGVVDFMGYGGKTSHRESVLLYQYFP
jgi:hypothetical protein